MMDSKQALRSEIKIYLRSSKVTNRGRNKKVSKYQGWKSKKYKMNSKIAHKTKTINPNRTVKITNNLVLLSRFKS